MIIVLGTFKEHASHYYAQCFSCISNIDVLITQNDTKINKSKNRKTMKEIYVLNVVKVL